jgi:FkbM family methyltransferase
MRDRLLHRQRLRPLSTLKSLVVSPGRRPRRIKGGALRGITMNLDLQHQTQIFLGLYEVELKSWLEKLAGPANTAIDVGAGEGTYSLYFLLKSSAERILAFEPAEPSRRQLLTNLSLNGFQGTPRIELSSMFVSSHDDIQECALDSVIDEARGPFVVKIDVEGAEADVLRGACRLLKRDSAWIVEVHSRKAEMDCIRLFNEFQMKTVAVHSAWWRLVIPEHRPLPVNHWLIALRRGSG